MYQYTVDGDAKLVVITFEGFLDDRELIAYITDLVTNTEYGESWRSLLDMTKVSEVGLTAAGIRNLIHASGKIENRLRGARAAVIAAAGSATFGMARMYATLTDAAPYDVRVFSDPGEAKRWLMA